MKIGLLDPLEEAMGDVVVTEVVREEVLVVEVVMVAAVALVAVMVVVEATEGVMEDPQAAVSTTLPAQAVHLQTLLPILPRLEESLANLSMSATCVTLHPLCSEAIAYTIQLPWSTSNEDLVELFTTIGTVERAEIQYEPNGRSRGTGVVKFDSRENAETAISTSSSGILPMLSTNPGLDKFTGYQYGGRPLGLTYAKYQNPGDAMEGQEESGGMTQDQIM